jgi:hypothetical protein
MLHVRLLAATALVVVAGFSSGLVLRRSKKQPRPPEINYVDCASVPVESVMNEKGMSLKPRPGFEPNAPPLDPRNPMYDPIVLENAGLDAFDIFAAEPTDSAWASTMETRITAQLVSDFNILAPTGKNVTATCHWSTCKLSVDIDRTHKDEARAVFGVAQYGDRTTFSQGTERPLDEQSLRVSAIVLFHDERDLDNQARAYQGKREAFMANVSPEDPLFGPLVRREK